MKYPLGRIHPHGSGGKSVYQRSAEEVNSNSTGLSGVIFGGLGVFLLSLAVIGLIIAPESFTFICVLAAVGKVLLD